MCVCGESEIELHLFFGQHVIVAVQNVHGGVNVGEIIFGRFYASISLHVLLGAIVELSELSCAIEKRPVSRPPFLM